MFCRGCEAAPATRRGGWLSAWRRRHQLGASAAGTADAPLDASNLHVRLWLGAAPAFDRPLPRFDVIVLAAAEIQPATLAFAGPVVRVPLRDDGDLRVTDLRGAIEAGRAAARAVASGRRVLVSSSTGRERGALVAAIALGMLTRQTPPQLIALIRQKRHPSALSQPRLQQALYRVSRLR